jgi:hypothetical protein
VFEKIGDIPTMYLFGIGRAIFTPGGTLMKPFLCSDGSDYRSFYGLLQHVAADAAARQRGLFEKHVPAVTL